MLERHGSDGGWLRLREEWEISQGKTRLQYVNLWWWWWWWWWWWLLAICQPVTTQNSHLSSDRPDFWSSCLLFTILYWTMIRCTASCKDVRILSPFLQQNLVQISSHLSRQKLLVFDLPVFWSNKGSHWVAACHLTLVKLRSNKRVTLNGFFNQKFHSDQQNMDLAWKL